MIKFALTFVPEIVEFVKKMDPVRRAIVSWILLVIGIVGCVCAIVFRKSLGADTSAYVEIALLLVSTFGGLLMKFAHPETPK